jgi:hypothetical protein
MNFAYGSTVGAIDHDDFDWLLDVATDTGLDQCIRAAAFRDALYLLRIDGQPVEGRPQRFVTLRKISLPGSKNWSNGLVPAKPDKSYAAREAKWQKQAQRARPRRQRLSRLGSTGGKTSCAMPMPISRRQVFPGSFGISRRFLNVTPKT